MLRYLLKINEVPAALENKIVKGKKYLAIAEIRIKHFMDGIKGSEQIMYEIADEKNQKLIVPSHLCSLLKENAPTP